MSVGAQPACQLLGQGVHEYDFAAGVGSDEAFPHAAQSGCEPSLAGTQAAFHFALVDGDLDGAPQVGIADRLQNVTERLGQLGSVHGCLVGMGGHVDDGRAAFEFQRGGRVNAVHLAADADVHQHQVERCGSRTSKGLLSGPGDRRHGVTHALQPPLNVGGDQSFIFHHEDLLLGLFG